MKAALCELVIEGIETNIEEQLSIIGSETFDDGSYDLTIIERLGI
jgi:acetyl-CoA carboxylase biotin carboxylase subunit